MAGFDGAGDKGMKIPVNCGDGMDLPEGQLRAVLRQLGSET
jgi:hypothetical protein